MASCPAVTSWVPPPYPVCGLGGWPSTQQATWVRAPLEGCGPWGSQPGPWPGAGECRGADAGRTGRCASWAGALSSTQIPSAGPGVAREPEGSKGAALPNTRTDSATFWAETHLRMAPPCHQVPRQGLPPRPSLTGSLFLAVEGCGNPALGPSLCSLETTVTRLSQRQGHCGTLALSNICGETTEGRLGVQGQAWPLAASLFITSFTSRVKAPQFQPERSREK